MQFKKIVISLLLLLTYSLGFAHNLVPHCQDLSSVDVLIYQEKENHHHHEHHHHSFDEESSSSHKHILHKEHYDNGLYDLLECFLSEMEHPASDCSIEHYFPLNTNDYSIKKIAKPKLIIVLFAVLLDFGQKEATTNYNTNVNLFFLNRPLEQAPHRGPPSFTC